MQVSVEESSGDLSEDLSGKVAELLQMYYGSNYFTS